MRFYTIIIVVFFFLFFDFSFLCRHNVADCRLLIPRATSAITSPEDPQVPGDAEQSIVKATFTYELLTRKLVATIRHEDYGDLEAPPRLPQAQHGPVVFNHKKKRPKHPSKGTKPKATNPNKLGHHILGD